MSGRKTGSKNEPVASLQCLEEIGDTKGMMLTGFTKVNNRLTTEIATTISPLAALLYIKILSHYNSKLKQCFPSIDILRRETGISRRKISDLLTQLNKHGYLKVRSGGRHYANNYWFPKEDFFDPGEPEMLMAGKRKSIQHTKKKELKKQEEFIPYRNYNDDDFDINDDDPDLYF